MGMWTSGAGRIIDGTARCSMDAMRRFGVVAGLSVCAYGCGGGAGRDGPGTDDGGAEAVVGRIDARTERDSTPPGTIPTDDGGDSPGDDGSIGYGLVTYDDAATAVDPNAAYSVTLTMTGFTVPPGGEVYKCQDFASPFRGQAVDITRYELAMSPGSHHMILFDTAGATDGPVVDCSGLQIGESTFGAQSETATATYPDGIGAAVPAGTGFTMNSHYINAGASPIQGSVKVTMFVARAGVVTQHAGSLQFVLTSISIPPTGQPATVSGSCSVSHDINLLSANSHMHQRATQFVATAGGTTLYRTDVWADPPGTRFSPPLLLKANDAVTWSCTYVNDTGSTLTFGPSATTNVMCNFNGTYYPVPDVSSPGITCLQ